MRAVTQGFVKMRDTTCDKTELLTTIRTNRDKHIKEYKEAVDGYKEKVVERAKEIVSNFEKEVKRVTENGELVLVGIQSMGLVLPVSHEKDYNQVIKMLEMEQEKIVKVTSAEFACYVMDDWDWKEDFTRVSTMYMKKAF